MKAIRLLATFVVAIMIGFTAGPTPASAQGAIFDHHICYKVAFARGTLQVSTHAGDVLSFMPLQFPILGEERGCVITPKPTMFCAPFDKKPRKGPLGTDTKNDFFVYKMKCLSLPDITQGVGDQFVRGPATIKRKPTARLLLVPAYKHSTPPLPCSATAPHQCGGVCPVGLDCRPGPNDVCGCFDPTTPDQCGGNICNGVCPTGQICKQSTAAGVCDCFPDPPIETCAMGADGQCGGVCADPAKSCKQVAGANDCRCQ